VTRPEHQPAWQIRPGRLPVVATAIHSGHDLRPAVAALTALDGADRRREEDPHTERLLPDDTTQVVVDRSRFEVDLNRPRDAAVYRTPEDAWGLTLWKTPLPPAVVEDSLALYDRFYAELDHLLQAQIRRFGRVLVLDIHSYNYRRQGPHAPAQAPAQTPEINLGTGPLDGRWPAVTERFVDALSRIPFLGGHLDVRENVRFKGGHLCRHIAEHFGDRVCPLAVEVKKIFMDEWSEQVYAERLTALKTSFTCLLPELLDALLGR
jgi:N-formylglutamate amidohydrolase